MSDGTCRTRFPVFGERVRVMQRVEFLYGVLYYGTGSPNTGKPVLHGRERTVLHIDGTCRTRFPVFGERVRVREEMFESE